MEWPRQAYTGPGVVGSNESSTTVNIQTYTCQLHQGQECDFRGGGAAGSEYVVTSSNCRVRELLQCCSQILHYIDPENLILTESAQRSACL